MVWGRSYRISEPALNELDELDPAILKALGNHKGQTYRKREFNELLARLGPKQIDPGNRKLIRKAAQLSLLRLERFIPNRSVREWVDALVFAVLIAALVRTFLIAPFKIPSGSMIPTIEIGDHIFATMFSYGIPVPFTGAKLATREIDRGDIVIFPFPENPDVDYIKRVIGKGGETVEIRHTRVLINGEPLEETYAYYDPKIVEALERNGQTQPQCNHGCGAPIRIPDGYLFVMGDNRFNSSDSRVWGFVDQSTVKGRGWMIYFSHDPDKSLFGGYRLGRIASVLK